MSYKQSKEEKAYFAAVKKYNRLRDNALEQARNSGVMDGKAWRALCKDWREHHEHLLTNTFLKSDDLGKNSKEQSKIFSDSMMKKWTWHTRGEHALCALILDPEYKTDTTDFEDRIKVFYMYNLPKKGQIAVDSWDLHFRIIDTYMAVRQAKRDTRAAEIKRAIAAGELQKGYTICCAVAKADDYGKELYAQMGELYKAIYREDPPREEGATYPESEMDEEILNNYFEKHM